MRELVEFFKNKKEIFKKPNIKEGKSPNYQIYHETLSSAIEEVKEKIENMGFTIGDLFPPVEHVNYGSTWRGKLDLMYNNQLINSASIQIYRMDSGRYELNFYINGTRFPKKTNQNVDENKEPKNTMDENLKKEYKRLKDLTDGKLNANFKEGYVQNSAPFELGSGTAKTVSSIANDMYSNPAVAFQTIRQPLQPDEAIELAITRTLKSGSPVKDMGFYDEINWHLQTLGFPAKNALDIKNVILKMMAK